MKAKKRFLSILLCIMMVLGLMPAMSLTVHADSYVASVTNGETTTNYSDFATALSNWSDGSTLTLLDNVSYANTISVTSGSKTFDLNNHNITKTGDHGSVFCVRGGSLTVNGPGNISGGKGMNDGENEDYHRGGGFHVSSSGSVVVNNVTITGNQANWGGGVFVGGSGTFIMNNSVISNNHSVNYSGWTSGGGVWIESGSFVMNGGTITANTADVQICGIHVFGDSSFQVSGNAVIADNKRGDTQLNASGTITVAGTLTEGANIGVTHEAGLFTNSTNTDYNDVSKFTSDNTNYVVGRNSNGQLLLGIPVQVTYKVVNGTWSNGSTDDKTENVVSGSTPVSVPTGMIAADGYKGGAWDVDPATATITAATTFTYSFEAKTPISQDVTFKVVNGKWNDDTNADKTVTLTGYEGDALKLVADQIPAVGNKPNDTYKEGAWNVTPSTETEISGATTYTYTYAQKEKATVATAPTTKSLTYNGSAQALVNPGTAEGGTIQYAFGTDATTAPTDGWSALIPTGTEAKTYYVWYKAVGDSEHLDSDSKCVTVTIAEATVPSTGYVEDVTGTSEASGSYTFGQRIVNNDNLKALLSLSDDEINQGTKVWLSVSNLGDIVPQIDKDLIDGAKGDFVVGLYLDINLYKKIGSNDAVKVTETNGKVKVSILIPEKLWKSGRTFEIIRIHEGVATVIPGSYDENTHVFTFETDEFSTYAIAYKDAVTPSSDSGSSPAPVNTTTIPKTDGNTGLGIWYLILAMSASVLGLLVFVRIRKEN